MVALNTIPAILGVLFYQVLIFFVVRDFCYLFAFTWSYGKKRSRAKLRKTKSTCSNFDLSLFSLPKDLAHLRDIGSRSLFQASYLSAGFKLKISAKLRFSIGNITELTL